MAKNGKKDCQKCQKFALQINCKSIEKLENLSDKTILPNKYYRKCAQEC